MRSLITAVVLAAAFGPQAGAVSFGRVPGKIRYQGVLSQGGALVNGQKTMQFAIYGTAASDDLQWQGSTQPVTLTNGLFSATVGIPVIRPVYLQSGGAFLETVVGGATLSPREEIVSVPFALKAGEVDGVNVAPESDENGIFIGLGALAEWPNTLNVSGDLLIRPSSASGSSVASVRLYAQTLTGAAACNSSAACGTFCNANLGQAVARVRLRAYFGDSDVILAESACYTE